ncbi:hypothetical protein PLESTB_001057700 [Pleodorina starrii]|uniref:Uncharacterized protein n=1 Tax=Pleodorina starrii TaxID=330485 RepID=A0A9W6F4E1_9CHLO|nr:hypothetical protein PLESTB_001057700 [Pleodorina starrii]
MVELERAKVGLEQENSALKLKLRDMQASAARAAKERDGLSYQRTELESQLQQQSSHASHLLTQVTCLRSNLTSRLQELLDQHLAAGAAAQAQISDTKSKTDTAATNKVNVHVVQSESVEDELGDDTEAAADAADDASAPAVGAQRVRPNAQSQAQLGVEGDDATAAGPDVTLSLQQQLDRELEALTRAHQRVVEQTLQLQEQLRRAEGDKTELRADLVGARRRLEQAEANAAAQQQVLQLRCEALEQENEQLTGMNQELQQRLEGAQAELSTAMKQWSSDGAQLAKQAADLGSTNGRLREAEAELRALQGKLAAATTEAQAANVKILELQEQAAVRASSLDAAGSILAEREAELAAAVAELRQLREQVAEHQQARDALSVELREATESLRDQQREMTELKKQATEELDEVRSQLAGARSQAAEAHRDKTAAQLALATAQRELAAAQQAAEVQAQALVDSNAQLLESRAALTATGERLSHALEELAASMARAAEANSQYLTTKQSVITTAKQLASVAKDHSSNLAKLHAAEAELASLREQLVVSRSAEAVMRGQADAADTAAREAREAAEAAGAEARRLRSAYEGASADLRRKIMLLTAIARMADKGQAGAGGGRGRDGQVADPADGYGAMVSEQRLRLKICESPLPLLGALTAGIMDSSRLRHLALDMDTSREVTWEKAGLRICCLAAAIGLNNSLQTLQLGGWTWGELGNGTALPFLALGGGGGGGVAGGMLRSVQLATNLFDLEAAAMLKDLLAAGLVELAAVDGGGVEEEGGGSGQRASSGAGQGMLYLYSGNERLDIWYREMLQLADRRAQDSSNSSGGGSAAAAATAAAGPITARTAGPPSASSTRAGGPALSHSLSALSAALPVASDDARTSAAAPTTCPSASSTSGNAASVDCDLSSEALESHHMVLVMTVLLTCPGMKRLRLDGNKLGDGGAALLALGLASNAGLRELYLSRNGIRAAGARSLARCLEGANSTLLRLDLSGQRQLEGIGAAGAEAMAQALRVNRTLEELNLSSCGISGAATACFAGAIRAAGALRPQTPRGGGGGPPVAGAAGGGGGGSLRKLALSGNNVDAATSKALLAAAADRPGLTLSM